jgi:hypothetical protein
MDREEAFTKVVNKYLTKAEPCRRRSHSIQLVTDAIKVAF